MATVYVGSTATDLTLISGWSSLTDGDRIIFAEGAQTVNASGSMNSLDTTSKNMNALQFSRDWTGTIGSTANPFICNVSNGSAPTVTYDAAAGAFYYKPRASGTASLIKALGGGTLYLEDHSGTITQLEVAGNATANVADGAAVTNLYMDGGTVNAEYNSTAFTVATIAAGNANIQRPITTLNVMGRAKVTVFRTPTSATMPTGGTVNVYGGKLDWRGGAITTLNLFAPIDLSQVRNAMTITTINATASAYRASILTSPYAAITLPTPTIYANR